MKPGTTSNKPVFVACAAALIVGVTLFFSRSELVPGDILSAIARYLSRIMTYEIWYVGVLLLSAGALIERGSRRLGAALALSGLILALLLAIIPPSSFMIRDPSAFSIFIHRGSTYFFPLALALLIPVRFQVPWARGRPVLLWLLLTIFLISCLSLVSRSWPPWMDLLESSLGVVTFAAIVIASWCLAFRQGPRHVPPEDAEPKVKLECPRCHNQQEVAAGRGECAHCRLQILIALDEGVCPQCRYPRRGLISDTCPECGAAFPAAT
jgi:hypothetical protein